MNSSPITNIRRTDVEEISQKEAIEYDRAIVEMVEKINYSMVILAKMIKEFKEKRMYLALDYSSFREWYKDKRIPHTTVYRALTVSDFVEKYELPETAMTLPQKKLDMLASLDNRGVIDKGNVDEWVEKAKALTEDDFVKDYKRARSGIESEQPLPVGTYLLVKKDDLYADINGDDSIENIGKYNIYKQNNMFFVKVAPNE